MYIYNKVLVTLLLMLGIATGVQAQDKIINPDISYAGTERDVVVGGIAVSGVEGYEDYVLTGISGLAVGQRITVPGSDITDAVKRYWKHGLFSKVAIAADSIVGDKIYLHIYLAVRPRVSTINYIGLKKSEREDMDNKLGLLKGMQVTPNALDRAKILAKKYFDDKGYKNADIEIVQRDDVANKNQVILDIMVDKKRKSRYTRSLSTETRKSVTRNSRATSSRRVPLPKYMKPASWPTSSSRRNIRPNGGRMTRTTSSPSTTSMAISMHPSSVTA